MIDHEKLMLVNKLCENFPYECDLEVWCGKKGPRLFVIRFEDADGMFHEYGLKNIDELISKIQELTQNKSKAEICIKCGLRQGTNGTETWQLAPRGSDIFCEHEFISQDKPKPKYEVGSPVFYLDGNKIIEFIVKDVYFDGKEYSYIDHVDNDGQFDVIESALYPSKQALIEAQIEMWQKMKEEL